MEKKYHYKRHQSNADMNATHLIGLSNFLQRDGVAKVNKFLHVDQEITNISNSQHGQNPNI